MTTNRPATTAPPRPVGKFDDIGPVVFPTRIVAGIKPTATVHLGQYFGAIRQQIELHHQYPGQSFFAVDDYLALAAARQPSEIRAVTLDVTCAYLALGLDPRKTTLYRQSDVPQVTELAVILSCLPATNAVAATPWLARDAALAAAGILAVRGTLAPVGPDTRPMVCDVRAIAQRFNECYGRLLFPLPEPVTTMPAPLPGTDGHKMSVSLANAIGVFHSFRQVDDTMRGLAPDRVAEILPGLLALLPNERGAGLESGGERLAAAVDRAFARPRDRYSEWKTKPDDVLDILRDGSRRAREEAAETLDEVRALVGL
jgi:tryptophanyl-tRNA synthetase